MSWRDRLKEKIKEKKESGGRFKLAEGGNTLRILPTLESKKDKEAKIYLSYFAHGDVGPKKRFIRCGKDEKGEGECWLCKKIAALQKSDSKAQRRRAEAMAPREQFLV